MSDRVKYEAVPLEGPLPAWLVREQVLGTARFILSPCCGAPVWQLHEPAPELCPVVCPACWRELGAPGREDLERMAQ